MRDLGYTEAQNLILERLSGEGSVVRVAEVMALAEVMADAVARNFHVRGRPRRGTGSRDRVAPARGQHGARARGSLLGPEGTAGRRARCLPRSFLRQPARSAGGTSGAPRDSGQVRLARIRPRRRPHELRHEPARSYRRAGVYVGRILKGRLPS